MRRLKPHQLIFYGLPGLPLAMLGLPLFVYLPTFYSEELGLSLSAVGLALLIARSLDVITDPLIGLINDRFTPFSGRGFKQVSTQAWRRKSFILLGVPLLLVGLNFLLKPENGVSGVYLFGWSFITYLGWTLINIPWLAWGAEISSDYHEKSVLASSREIFSVIGTVFVISLPVLLSIQSDLQQTLALLANLLTWILPLALIPLLWKVSDRPYANSIALQKTIALQKRSKPNREQLLKTVSHPAIKRLLPAYFINSFANALPATLFILFVTYVLKMPDQVGVLLVCYFLSAIVGLPLWLYLARRTDKHRSWSIALIVAIGSFIWVPLLGQGDFNAFLVICLVSGFALGADVVLPASIQADISQHLVQSNISSNVHSKTGKESLSEPGQDSTGLLFGLWGLLTKLALALAVGIAFPVLDSVGLKTETPSGMAVTVLAALYALLPVILKLWVVLQMWHFPFGQNYFFPIEKGQNKQSCHQEKHVYKSERKGEPYENLSPASNASPVSVATFFKRVQ